MEQMFQFKTHGNLTFEEMDQLTAEDRSWWMDRLKKHFEDQNKEASSANVPTPNIPRPNIPRP